MPLQFKFFFRVLVGNTWQVRLKRFDNGSSADNADNQRGLKNVYTHRNSSFTRAACIYNYLYLCVIYLPLLFHLRQLGYEQLIFCHLNLVSIIYCLCLTTYIRTLSALLLTNKS